MNVKCIQGNQIDKRKTVFVLIVSIVVLFALYLHVSHIIGNSLWKHNSYDSFTLQALRWREGKIKFIDKNDENYDEEVDRYKYLELAIYNDDYYLSFPQVPAIPMYLLTFIFEDGQTPSNFMSMLYNLTAFSFIYLCCRRKKVSLLMSVVGALLVCVGSSAFNISLSGGVWFQAQALSLALTSAAFYLILCDSKVGWHFAMALLALAVGCRPFQILYFFFFALLMYKRYLKDGFSIGKLYRALSYFISPALIGGVYMIYNYVRFGSITEFGHTYLPEFSRVEANQYGQFSFNYIKDTFNNFVYEMPKMTEEGLQYSTQGFCFLVSNVLFVVTIIAFFNKLHKWAYYRDNKDMAECWLLMILTFIHTSLFFMHKTAGGFQFGARYMADVLPALMVCVLYSNTYSNKCMARLPDKKNVTFIERFKVPIVLLCSFGMALNIYGGFKIIII